MGVCSFGLIVGLWLFARLVDLVLFWILFFRFYFGFDLCLPLGVVVSAWVCVWSGFCWVWCVGVGFVMFITLVLGVC